MNLFDDIREHVIFHREDGDLKISCKFGNTWHESIMTPDDIKRLKNVLDEKSDNSKNLIDLAWG